jgi:hypothetical protein
MTGDDRFSPEQAEVDEAAKAAPPPPRRTEPCRRYVDNPVTADEIERFAEKLAPKPKKAQR